MKARTTGLKEWECPRCTANNPADDGISFGDELFCFYCGVTFEVRERDGKPRFVEL